MSPCFHPGRCPDCEEDFPCAACREARVKTDGDWCRHCAEALDKHLEFLADYIEEGFNQHPEITRRGR